MKSPTKAKERAYRIHLEERHVVAIERIAEAMERIASQIVVDSAERLRKAGNKP